MRLVRKPDALLNLSGNDLLPVNLMDKSIYLKRKDIHLGFERVKPYYQIYCVSATASRFREDCGKIMIDTLLKVLGESPLVSPLVRNSTALDPQSFQFQIIP